VLIKGDGSFCGVGYIMPSDSSAFESQGYSVVAVNCIGLQTMAHEMGHNMGADHNQESAGTGTGWVFARGYR
ncbi:unnamed protein product, partial [Discosporangium mesarthrocarpum]